MPSPSDSLPQDLAAAHAMILAQRETLAEEQALRMMLQSEAKVWALEIERLKLMLAKARREQFGQSSERGKQLIEQLELAISDLEETQAEEETKAGTAAPEKQREKRERTGIKPARRPLPENLPREWIVYPAPCTCGKCGGSRLRKLGEVVTSSLECEPRRWKVVEHVREKFSCRGRPHHQGWRGAPRRRVDLAHVIKTQFNVTLAERSAGAMLRRLGFRRLSVRPRHPPYVCSYSRGVFE
jgi:transposase